jgi:hypothetical protein
MKVIRYHGEITPYEDEYLCDCGNILEDYWEVANEKCRNCMEDDE